jgi:hypothetical protein
MGTSDDWPLSPIAMKRGLERAGFRARITGLEFGWRRLSPKTQSRLRSLEALGDVPILKYLAHTFMAIGEK